MTFTADLHLHSKYSRAVSPRMILPEMANWANLKGLDIISASDFTHPLWLRELKNQLEETSEGLYSLKSSSFAKASKDKSKKPLFMLTTELSSIYKQGDKLRRIHNLIFAPSLETVEKIIKEFQRKAFNLMADGRPILGISSQNLLELLLGIDENIILIPCHVWTPHFGVYGSASGFDSLGEAFGEYSKYIYGIETGLSSDPEMNWVVDELKSRSILSFSDAHSGPKMGREATVFTTKKETANFNITYKDITDAIKKDKQSNLKIQYTIEFYPEEGKYHYSGHRNCRVIRGPEELIKEGDICSVCKRRLTEGVLYRVQQLSDNSLIESEIKKSPAGIKWYTDKNKKHPPYVKLVPLNEIIAEANSSTVSSQKVKEMFINLCKKFTSEIEVLLRTSIDEIEKEAGDKVARAVEKVRRGEITIDPGYDGEYGKVKIEIEDKSEDKKTGKKAKPQLGLF